MPTSAVLEVIFELFCRHFPVAFLGWILNGFLDGFWIDFGMNFVLYVDVFGYIFEAS